MQKTYMIKETVNHFHSVTIDEELDIEDIVNQAKKAASFYDTGYGAISDILDNEFIKHGFNFEVKPNDCGTEIVDMEVIEEM